MTELEVVLNGGKDISVDLSGEKQEIEIDFSREEIDADLAGGNSVELELEPQLKVVMPKYHNELLGLDYEHSGHTGFASSKELEAVKTTKATETTLGMVKVGQNLNATDDGTLSVVTTDEAENDNTKPITSKAVHTIVGNIDSLLSII